MRAKATSLFFTAPQLWIQTISCRVSFQTAHSAYASTDITKVVRIETELFVLSLVLADASVACVLRRYAASSIISTQIFRKFLDGVDGICEISVDRCAEIRSASSMT